MVARVPWSMLKPCSFEEHADDVALIYAAKFASEAQGEAAWLATVIGAHGEPPHGAIRAVLARALRMAAQQVEASVKETGSNLSCERDGHAEMA